jgi:hypothetical protein
MGGVTSSVQQEVTLIMEHGKMGHQVEQEATPASAGRRWLWLVGCLAPLAAVVAVWVFNVPVNTVLIIGLLLLCPLAHLFMMRGGEHKH